MESGMTEENTDFYEELLPWFELKVSEFSKEGYSNIETSDLILCFKNLVWRHSVPQHYYQQVFEILNVNVNQYFDYKSLEAQVYNVSSLEEINFEEFF